MGSLQWEDWTHADGLSEIFVVVTLWDSADFMVGSAGEQDVVN